MKAFVTLSLIVLHFACAPSSSTNQLDRKNQDATALIRKARTLIGSPYRYGGTTPKGFDCSGLIKYLYQSQNVHLSGGSRDIFRGVKTIPHDKVKPGDLVFFTLNGKIDHVALVSDINKNSCHVIHSTSSKGVIEQDYLKSSYWTKKFYRYGRVNPN